MKSILLGNGDIYSLVNEPTYEVKNINGLFGEIIKFSIIGELDEIRKSFSDSNNLNVLTVVNNDQSLYKSFTLYNFLIGITIDGNVYDDIEGPVYEINLSKSLIGNKSIQSLESNLMNMNYEVAKSTVDIEKINIDIEKFQSVSDEIIKQIQSLIPPTNTSGMKLKEAKTFMICKSKALLSEYLENNPIESDCHGEKAKYSITSEKQQYLLAMINMTEMSKYEEDGEIKYAYQPSWNASGEPCTYDWNINMLKQLAMEMESVVRPLISKQQEYEVQINKCTTLKQLNSIEIKY